MKIVTLLKTFSGEEWLKPCLKSIYKHVDKIVILTSEISWIGGYGNPSIPEIENFIKDNDPEKKIHHVKHDEPNQLKHCEVGYKYIKDNFPDCDFVQLIDSDEVWNDEDMINAKKYLQMNPNHKAYRTHMHVYVKSPYYRIEPIEPLKPTCFLKSNMESMGIEPRGCGIKPFAMMDNVFFHHYVFVRMHFNHVLEKLVQSHVSEKQPYETMDRWIPEVWNKLPRIEGKWLQQGIHPAIGFGHNWKRIKVITDNELPRVLRVNKQWFPIMQKFSRGM